MNKHTLGPWFIDYEGGGSMGRRALLKNADGETIGYLYEAEYEDENLIAAAPDLLAACWALVTSFHAVEYMEPHMKRAADMGRSAIAKATGETK
jgi:hypothetical protein